MDIHNFTATAKRQMGNLTRNVQGHLVGNTTPVAAMRAHMLEIEKALQKEDAGTQPGSTVSGNPAHAEIRELQVAMIQASEQAPSLEQFKVAQLEDPAISTMIMFLQDSREWTLTKKKKMAEDLPSQWRKYWPHLYLDDHGVLKIRSLVSRGEELVDRILVPTKYEERVYRAYHNGQTGGHPGRESTIARIRRIFLFPNMGSKIRNWVKQCELCNKARAHRMTNTGSSFADIYQSPWESVGADLVGPYKPKGLGGYSYILTLACHFSKFICLEPLKTKEAEEVAQAFERILCRIGIMKRCVCDNGSEFIAQAFQSICDRAGIKKVHTSPLHPESNGAVEASHREINKHLKLALQGYKRDWKEVIPMIEYCHNSVPLTGMAFCPFYLMYNRWPTQWADLPLVQKQPGKKRPDYDRYCEYVTARVQEAKTIILNDQLRAKTERALKSELKRKPVSFSEGDEVLVWRPAAAKKAADKTSAKLMWAAVGPMRVVRSLGRNCYQVKNLASNREYRVNCRDMFPYCKAKEEQRPEISPDPDDTPPEPVPAAKEESLPVPLCQEGQWVAVPRENRWFLANVLSYDDGTDEVTLYVSC